MGCASSKQSPCGHCQSPQSPIRRSFSVHIQHPPQRNGDSYHLVALTSTTLGSIKLESSDQDHQTNTAIDEKNSNSNDSKSKEFSIGVVEAKTWSSMINQRIPKINPRTPIRTPLGEPETINTWELMEGLEYSPLCLPNLGRCFSLQTVSDSIDHSISKLRGNDLEFTSTFRNTLEEGSPTNPFHICSPENEKPASLYNNLTLSNVVSASNLPHGENKVVIYFTSLRGVRKTYEDCCNVRMILKRMGVRVDERDVSMDSGFREELKELLGGGFNGGGLPRVFVKGRYIGGAEEVQEMHEDGELKKVLEGCGVADERGGGDGVCEACGDVRFMPCERCSGSCKICFNGDEDGEEGEWEFQPCPDCNENGLIRCSVCCY
ncbi:hypothetical protein HHK36_007215 [Tetracentron sinense]|uniref:Glutaredoxin domain-containing protein n=1 Tax=Tetracentron sinense TaxID=13715 RepID=A0A834ZIJ4_TETSI|nr:hypothetical protein HHK36_007215 [Tetracentron sinense]